MIKIEKKIIKNKPFFYLTEQVRLNKKYKKIQVYIGKNIPKNLELYYVALKEKEIKLVLENIKNIFKKEPKITENEIKEIEAARLKWKYKIASMSEIEQDKLLLKFAIQFIFESNAIEGSRLSVEEVSSIVGRKYIKKTISRKEILEVQNSIKVFDLIRKKDFKLNQRSIIELHKLLTFGLDIERGYKKVKIIVNNKETVPPGEVRSGMSELFFWLKIAQKEKRHPLFIAADFHNRFEYIHPFTDGNGRVGRIIFNWMLLKSGYGVILFKNRNRQSYFEALNQADKGRSNKLYRQCAKVYKKTINDL